MTKKDEGRTRGGRGGREKAVAVSEVRLKVKGNEVGGNWERARQ